MAESQIEAMIAALSEPETEQEAVVTTDGTAESSVDTTKTDDKGLTVKDNVVDAAKTEGTDKTDAVLDAEADGNVADPDPKALPEDVEALPRVPNC